MKYYPESWATEAVEGAENRHEAWRHPVPKRKCRPAACIIDTTETGQIGGRKIYVFELVSAMGSTCRRTR